VSATALSRGQTAALAALAIVCITFLAFFHLPLPWGEAYGFELPRTYLLGVWTALAVAVVFIASYVWSVVEEARRVADALTASEAALAREQRLSALGGLAAAAAHELGSPLATIAIAAKELRDQIPPDSAAMEDVELLISQSRRCRDILAGLAQAPEAAQGAAAIVEAPLLGLVEEAAENHVPPGIALGIAIDEGASGPEPLVPRSPEILQGLGNFIQNAGQFARNSVQLAIGWDDAQVWIVVADDGPGFPPWLLSNLGEPYVSTRAGDGEHMGLGVFIATTLLNRTGARVSFQNRNGARVVLVWERRVIDRAWAR
jgi:two-component system sensor histidine kinase RegB